MGFNIKIDDVDNVAFWIGSYSNNVSDQLSRIQSASAGIASLESFQGATADNVKAYFSEVHIMFAAALIQLLDDVTVRYGVYVDGYNGIEASKDACFTEDTLCQVNNHFSSSRTDFSNKQDSLSRALDNISDIVYLSAPSLDALDANLNSAARRANDLKTKVAEHEQFYAADASSIDSLLASVNQMLATYGANPQGGTSYTPGSFMESDLFVEFATAYNSSYEYTENNASIAENAYLAAQDRLMQRYEEEMARLAKEREDQGFWQMIGATLMLATGAVVIVLSAGTATPIVAGALVVFSASNFIEGAQHNIYGRQGDLTSFAVNPIRDTVFLGNQDVYDAANFVVSVGAGLAGPVASAVGAARAMGATIPKAAGAGAKAFGKGLAADTVIDTGTTIVVDPALRNAFGNGAKADGIISITHGIIGAGAGVAGGKIFNSSASFSKGYTPPKKSNVSIGKMQQGGKIVGKKGLDVLGPIRVEPGQRVDIVRPDNCL